MKRIQDITAPEVLKNNFMPYAMSVIVSRAIPEIDGLKPSHRKVLFTMYEMGLLGNQRTKSANIAARTLLLNPHSDQSQYETMVRMTQNRETLLAPLVDGKGSFGKHYSRDTAFASSRYTEAKLMPIAAEFFRSIKKDAVDFVDNYDSTRKEPVLLPVTFPNILANPTEGIAVGVASSIPSFNLSELCEATIERIKHPRKDLLDIMPAPDFTTGGYLLWNESELRNIYKTGKGSVTLRSRYTVDTKNRIIEVNEIPYTTTAEAIIEQVVSLIKAGRISEILDIRNEIGLKGFRLAIDYKRGVDPEKLMNKLFLLTKLQDAYSFNMTVLIDGRPKLLGVYDILDEWVKWRKICVRRELTYDCAKKKHELHLLEGLVKIHLDIDKVIKAIRGADRDEDVVPVLMKKFRLSEEQAAYVAEIKLRNLNKDYILNKTKAIDALKDEIATLEKQISSEKEIEKLIIKTLKDVQKKYSIPRKTEILKDFAPISKPEEASDYDVKVYVTKENYIKKIALTSLKNSPEVKFKEGDEVLSVYDSKNSKELLIFTDKQTVYKVPLAELKDSKPSDIADYANNLCGIGDENILLICTSDAGSEVVIGFDTGKVARFPLSVYETKQNRKKLLSAFSSLGGPLGIYIISAAENFAMTRSDGKKILFSSDLIPLKTTRTTQGVQTLRLSRSTTAVSFEPGADENFRVTSIPSAGKSAD